MIFHKLKVVELNFSNDYLNSFPFDVLVMFNNVETLRVVHGDFKDLFPTEGLAGDEKNQLIFTKTRYLELIGIPNMKTIWNEVLQTLESILVDTCGSLIILAPFSASFKCLTSLKIDKCRGLLSLFSCSTAESLVQLKTLTVCNCNQLKVIVSDVGDETVDEITFIQLECLKLECLPSIASFCSAKHKFKFPCLIDIVVYQCPSMEFFSKGVSTTPLLQRVRLTEAANTGEWLGDLNSTISFCYRKMVGLCGLQQSKVSEHSNLGNRWNAELPVEFLCELESLVIDEIAFSSYAVPSKLLESLNELKKLEVSNCEELEEVFDVQMGSSAECGHTDFLSKLKRFQLINLPRLRNIWNEHPQGILNFKQLNSLKVHHCSSLKTIFTPSMAEGLVQLQDVEVKYCNSVAEIISKGARKEAINEIILPLLQSIMLESLPALLSLNGGSELLKCPSLEKIEIVDCPTTFTSTFLRELQPNAFDGTTEAKVVLPPRLKHLKVSLVKIEKIWYNLGMSSFIENLTILNIDGCSNLEYLFSSSVVLNCLIHVKSLELSNCKSMKEILQIEKMGNIVLLNLELVKLKNLQQLTRFCSGNLIECNGLIELSIEDCPELGGLISNSANSNNSTLFDEKVKFPNIERLNIVGVDGLKLIWGNELQQDSFCRLNHLCVKDAKQLMRIFPPNLLRKFKNLEKLFVHGCDVTEEVFDTKAVIDMEEGGGVAVSQLKKLRVYNNPNLKHVWNEDPKRILSFHNLNSAKIRGCPSLKSVFPSSITRDLLVLEKLDVRDSAVEEIVAVDEEQIEGATVLNFPQLKVLVLKKLPKLDRLFPRTHASEWPALQKICIIQCYRFQQPTLSFKKIFPNLETLALNGNEVKRVRESQFPVELFQKLKVLKLDYFDEKSAVFPYDLLRSVHNLETLVVSHSKFKLLFPPPVLLSDKNYPLIPTRMCHLNLLWLPNMKAMCNEVLQALERLYVRGCDSLIILAPSSASFESLVSLVIDECNGLVSLVTCSVAKRLSQLEEFRIRRCNKLKVIVSDEADETTYKICFSKLQTLELDCLPSLTCFCSVNCKFQFPCLTEVVVNQCPNMEFFSQGASNTAILETVHQKNNGFWLGNLNSTIHFLYKKLVGFCGMRHLKLSEFSNLKDRWHNELPAEFLYELKSLEIDEAVFSSYAIPSNLLESLNKLEELEVNNCELLEEVFDLEGLSDQAQAQRGMLSKLNRFHLINLPSLTRVWNEHPLLNFKHLKALKVDNCSSLRMIFTPSMTRVLVQLQEIEVTNCVSVKEIVSDGQEEAETDQIISFPELNSLVFNSLPKLTTFHSGRDIVQCPSLQKITSVGCPKIDLFTFSAHDEGTLIFFGKVICSSLKELRVDWSKSIKKIWDGQLAAARELFCSLKVLELKHFPTDYSFLPSNFLETMSSNLEEFIVSDASFGELFSQEVATYNDEESSTRAIPLRQLTLSKLPLLSHLIKDQNKRGSLVPHLEALEVGECTKLTILVPSFCSFQNLKTLTVSKCHGLLYLITPSTARSLSQLTRFEIAECEMLDEIVGSEGDEIEAEIGLSRLKHLELHCLPKLKRFCSGNAAFSFPCLEEVTVRECPKMDYFVEGELSTPNLESVLTTEDESEWCWEGNLNATIQKLFNKTITGEVEEH